MGFIAAADPASKTAYVFDDVMQLANAMAKFGYIPLRTDGGPMTVQEFEGGYLLDGAPINVWMGQGWFEGQRELLEPFWTSGSIPRPPGDVINAPLVPMPQDEAEKYAAYKAAGMDVGILGENKGLILAGVGVGLLWWFTSGSKPRSRGPDSLPFM